jgi:hypothetical protein
MKLKILLLVAGVAVIGSSVTVLVIQSHSRPLKFRRRKASCQRPSAITAKLSNSIRRRRFGAAAKTNGNPTH